MSKLIKIECLRLEEDPLVFTGWEYVIEFTYEENAHIDDYGCGFKSKNRSLNPHLREYNIFIDVNKYKSGKFSDELTSIISNVIRESKINEIIK